MRRGNEGAHPGWHFEGDEYKPAHQTPLGAGEVEALIQAARNASAKSRHAYLEQTRDEERPDGQGYGYPDRFGK